MWESRCNNKVKLDLGKSAFQNQPIHLGYQTLYSDTTGGSNTAIGHRALLSNTTGAFNNAIGFNALLLNTSGVSNTANGTNALFSNTTGSSNLAFGSSSLFSNTTGYYNTVNGVKAFNANTTGHSNTALGYQAGYGDGTTVDQRSITDTYATFVGFQASRDASIPNSSPLTNITAIGKNARVATSNSIVLGGTGADAVNVGIGTTNPTVSLDVAGAVRPGSSASVTTCGLGQANGEGSQRYNYTSHEMEYCNGTSWVSTNRRAVSAQYCIGNLVTQTMPNGVDTIINFDSIDYDSHNAVTTGSAWVFTVPISGVYRITSIVTTINYNNWQLDPASSMWLLAKKNGTLIKQMAGKYTWLNTSVNTSQSINGSTSINAVAGDTLSASIAIWRNGTPTDITTNGNQTCVSIERVAD